MACDSWDGNGNFIPREPIHVLRDFEYCLVSPGLVTKKQAWRYIIHQSSLRISRLLSAKERTEYFFSILIELPLWEREVFIQRNSHCVHTMLEKWLSLQSDCQQSPLELFDDLPLTTLSKVHNYARDEIVNDLEAYLDHFTSAQPLESVVDQSPSKKGHVNSEYSMNRSFPRGKLYIINNHSFPGNKKRKGCDKDKLALLDFAEKYGLRVEELYDMGCAEVAASLLRSLAVIPHYSLDITVIAVMTHGGVDGLGREVLLCQYCGLLEASPLCMRGLPVQSLIGLFTDAPGLCGVPRVFIVQSCRAKISAELRQSPAVETDDARVIHAQGAIQPAVRCNTEEESHVFVLRSAISGQYSFRDTSEGSFLVQDFCHVLLNAQKCISIEELVEHIRKRARNRNSSVFAHSTIPVLYEFIVRIGAQSQKLVFHSL